MWESPLGVPLPGPPASFAELIDDQLKKPGASAESKRFRGPPLRSNVLSNVNQPGFSDDRNDGLTEVEVLVPLSCIPSRWPYASNRG